MLACGREESRIAQMRAMEKEFYSRQLSVLAGVDEAGRGPLAGPVVAAACYIPPEVFIQGIDDSKRLSASSRASINLILRSHPGVVYGIGIAASQEIDLLNIRQATLLAMRRAVDAIPIKIDHLFVDGRDDPGHSIPATPFIGGDSLCYLIAAASILAKEERDRMMVELDKEWPQYGFARHKGYPTADHIDALHRYGVTPYHRRSFRPVRECLYR